MRWWAQPRNERVNHKSAKSEISKPETKDLGCCVCYGEKTNGNIVSQAQQTNIEFLLHRRKKKIFFLPLDTRHELRRKSGKVPAAHNIQKRKIIIFSSHFTSQTRRFFATPTTTPRCTNEIYFVRDFIARLVVGRERGEVNEFVCTTAISIRHRFLIFNWELTRWWFTANFPAYNANYRRYLSSFSFPLHELASLLCEGWQKHESMSQVSSVDLQQRPVFTH